jgi:hypothetical protein
MQVLAAGEPTARAFTLAEFEGAEARDVRQSVGRLVDFA